MRMVLKVRSGEAPPPPRSLRLEIPIELDRHCMKCLRVRPEDRYATARELAAALRRCWGSTAWRTRIRKSGDFRYTKRDPL